MKHADFYTVIYAAPELARAVADEGPLRLSRCLDVWSAGLCVLEMKLLQPLLESKFQSCCDDAEDGDGLNRFFQWLGSTEEALEPVKQISESSEVLQLIAGRMLLRDPLERSSPAQLLQEPALQQSYEALPDVMLEEPAETNPAPKPKTAYQLFQEAHREEARAELQTSGLSLCLSCCLLPAASQISLLEASTSTCHRFFNVFSQSFVTCCCARCSSKAFRVARWRRSCSAVGRCCCRRVAMSCSCCGPVKPSCEASRTR